jgi:hypothetical protein
MAKKKIISINRAPVLTLWAAIVAQRLGFNKKEALTLGRAVAGLNAQTKGRRLGIFKPHEQKAREAREKKRGEEFWVEVCGRPVPAKNTDDGIRAVKGDKAIEPASVQRYLEAKFGDDLEAVVAALQILAKAYRPKELAYEAYPLYEQFRPAIPGGKAGWGAKGNLDLGFIEELAKRR